MSSDPSAFPARGDAWLAAIFFAGFAAMTIVASSYPAIARAMPMLVGTFGMVLSAIQFVRTVSRRRGSPARDSTSCWSGQLLMLAWLITAVALVGLFGILAGGAVFVVLFLRTRLGEPWSSAIPSGLVLSAALHLMLERGLDMRLFEGLFWR
jgi:hypothetical protein